MESFVSFLLSKVYKPIVIPKELIDKAFSKTVADVKYHLPNLKETNVKERIEYNENELAIFLFRLGCELHANKLESHERQIHWLLKELCSCELYFNNSIDTGFYVIHGQGTVIGSRNTIGKGFIIHHGCTIGHKKNGEGNGVTIGNNVTMYCNSSVLGDIRIEDDVVIGAHNLINSNIKKQTTIIAQQQMKKKQTRE